MLERILGGLLGLVSGLVIIVGSLFAIPSMLRYARLRAM
jgi:hypothetical protein